MQSPVKLGGGDAAEPSRQGEVEDPRAVPAGKSFGLLTEMLVDLFAERTDFLRKTGHNKYTPHQVLW